MTITRRRALTALGMAVGAAAGHACGWTGSREDAGCAALVGRRIRWVVPNAAGGGYDTESRLIRDPLERRLGAEIALENRPGAGGLIGARTIASAEPDGLTLGMIGVPGLLMSALAGRGNAVNPATDFTVLGRVSRSRQVWAAGPRAKIASFTDLIAAGAARPLLFAVSNAASPNVVSIAVAASLVGVRAELVGGFQGTRNAALAAMRGDVDLVCYNYGTIRPSIRSGELHPVLQISTRPIAADERLGSVAVLGGGSGAAAERARALGTDPAAAARTAAAVERVVSGGRLVVAPPRLPDALAGCLSDALHAVLTQDLDKRAAARLEPARAEEARADLQLAVSEAPALLNLARPLMESLGRRS